MIKETVSHEDIEFVKNKLIEYGYLQRKEQHHLREAMELQLVIDDLAYPKGVSYDSNGIVNTPKPAGETPAVNMKQHEQNYHDIKAEKYRKDYEALNDRYGIDDALDRIPKYHKITIELALFKRQSYETIAANKVTRQSISERVNSAIRSIMKEMKL